MTRCVLVLVALGLVATPAGAQIVVSDPGNLTQAVLIAERTLREYEELRAQHATIVRMARRLENLEGYRLPSIPAAAHDINRWEYARPWLQGLNTGDAGGAAYGQTVRRLERPEGLLQQLPAAARRAVENAYATVEITDSVAQMGGHQVALIRRYGRQLQEAINGLQDDVLNDLPRFHEITANLDKVAGGELIGRRQDTAANQLLSHALEQLLVRSKRFRDTEVAAMNMRLSAMQDGRAASASVVRGAANDLRTWRQP